MACADSWSWTKRLQGSTQIAVVGVALITAAFFGMSIHCLKKLMRDRRNRSPFVAQKERRATMGS